MSTPHPFIGIGSGRCGTQSLARILGGVEGAHVTHESQVYRPDGWEESVNTQVKAFARHAATANGLYGDVAFYHLPRVDAYYTATPRLRVVALIRDRDEVVSSFLARDGRGQRLNESYIGWDRLFPVIASDDPKERWRRYWDMYYDRVYQLKVPLMWLRTDQLNDDAALDELYDFLKVPRSGRNYPDQRRYNARRRET